MSPALQVLVVDDEPGILQSCSRVLERAGHRVQAVESARSALDLFERERFDLILTDIMLPDVSGLELIERIKERAPAATIVAITGYGTVETATESLRRGANGFLTKPFTSAELRAAVADAYAKAQLAREAIRAEAYEPLAAQFAGPSREAVPNRLLARLTQSTRRATDADLALLLGRGDGSGLTVLARDSHDRCPEDRWAQAAALRSWLDTVVVDADKPLD